MKLFGKTKPAVNPPSYLGLGQISALQQQSQLNQLAQNYANQIYGGSISASTYQTAQTATITPVRDYPMNSYVMTEAGWGYLVAGMLEVEKLKHNPDVAGPDFKISYDSFRISVNPIKFEFMWKEKVIFTLDIGKDGLSSGSTITFGNVEGKVPFTISQG